jgi:hypothetical protein
MVDLQATWTHEGRLFLWSAEGDLQTAIDACLPGLSADQGVAATRSVAAPGDAARRNRVPGVEFPLAAVIPPLAALRAGARVPDGIAVWSAATKLALELAARQRVVPTALKAEGRWRVLLGGRRDESRFRHLAAALPVASRCLPLSDNARTPVKLAPGDIVVRAFLDDVVDAVYRTAAYPGSARGWVLEFVEALRGENSAFSPRDARSQAVPAQLAAWSTEGERPGLRVGFRLVPPTDDQDESAKFALNLQVHPPGAPDSAVPVASAWTADPAGVELDGKAWPHPAASIVRGLARAARFFEPIKASLVGAQPCDLSWDAMGAWQFLDKGYPALKEAGFEVDIPEAFRSEGSRRIRARIRIEVEDESRIELDGVLKFRWEVVLGEHVLTGEEFAGLLARRQPLVKFREEWVLLDPAEIARLPDSVRAQGEMDAASALRAVLVGAHEGVPVVADDRLSVLVDALKNPGLEPVPAGFVGQLRPYQHRGFSWLQTLGRIGLGACLADDMGLGKTVQVIAHILARRTRHSPPSLVVCPTSVLGNWQREIHRFAPGLRIIRHHGMHRGLQHAAQADIVLTTYGLLGRDVEELVALPWDVVVLDEAQGIKNPESQRARSAIQLKGRHRVAMSGTPVENRLDELWSLFHFLLPNLLGSRAAFRRNVGVPIERFGDIEVARQLKAGVSPFLLRRLKTDADVAPDLPEKIEREEYVPLTREQAALYQQVLDEYMEKIQTLVDIERRGQVLAMLTQLKQVCNHPAQLLDEGDVAALSGRSGKLDRLVDLLDEIFDNGERTLVFTQYREMGSILQRHLSDVYGGEVPFLHGGSLPVQRDEMVRSFQEDEDAAPVLIISVRAGGTGLNLTRATHVIHYDRWWNPAVEDQATDRAHRIGQEHRVQVHKLVCQSTLEERIAAMLEDKRHLAEAVVASGERWLTELDDDALRKLVALGDDAVLE